MNETGAVIQEKVIGHTPAGFMTLDNDRKGLGVEAEQVVIGLETAHNLLIDYLIDWGYGQIYVLPPNLVKSSQGRYAQGEAKDDRRDAQLIADILRTDHGRLHAWQPDSLLTRQIQFESRHLLYLTRMIVRQTNHLRAILLRYYPAALKVFSQLDSPICLAFLSAYATPQKARQLSYEQFCEFLRRHHHTQRRVWPTCYAHLTSEYPVAAADTLLLYSERVQQLVSLLLPFVQAKTTTLRRLKSLFTQHSDAPIFDSLPGVGDFLAPALLAKLGDDRLRFPTPAVLQAIAGTCPVTARSGRSKIVKFRRGCDWNGPEKVDTKNVLIE
jgi:transposase